MEYITFSILGNRDLEGSQWSRRALLGLPSFKNNSFCSKLHTNFTTSSRSLAGHRNHLQFTRGLSCLLLHQCPQYKLSSPWRRVNEAMKGRLQRRQTGLDTEDVCEDGA